MIPCPSCHKPVEILDKHLGTLFTCPHCSAVFFVNFDGQPEMANHEAEPEVPTAEPVGEPTTYGAPPAEVDPNQGYGEQNFQSQNDFQNPGVDQSVSGGFASSEQNFGGEADEQSPHYGENQNFEAQDAGSFEAAQGFDGQSFDQNNSDGSNSEFSQQNSGGDFGASQNYDEPATEEAAFDFSQTLDQVPAQAPAPMAVSDSADFSDVTNFANADTTAGPITYVVVIDGIESSQLLYQLKEAMTDSRFGWDVADVLTRVGGGRLVLPALSPAKASVLINRIKYLPFKISWRQDVLSGA